MIATLLLAWCLQAAPNPDELPVRATAALRQISERLAGGPRRGYGEPVGGQPRTTARATAAMGRALWLAATVTGDAVHRDAALAAARELAWVQRESGGWDLVHAADDAPGVWYRRAARQGQPRGDRAETMRLDAALTPAALGFLLSIGVQTGDAELLAAADHGLLGVLRCQLASGGWPARWPPEPGAVALSVVATADGQAVTPAVIELLLAAAPRWPPALAAAVRAGDWLLRARLADGWASTQGADPRATAAALVALARLYRATGEERFHTVLAPALAALAAEARRAPALAVVDEVIERKRRPAPPPGREARARRSLAQAPLVAQLLAALDEQGRWPDEADATVCAARITALATFIAEYEPLPAWLEPFAEPRPVQHRR